MEMQNAVLPFLVCKTASDNEIRKRKEKNAAIAHFDSSEIRKMSGVRRKNTMKMLSISIIKTPESLSYKVL